MESYEIMGSHTKYSFTSATFKNSSIAFVTNRTDSDREGIINEPKLAETNAMRGTGEL